MFFGDTACLGFWYGFATGRHFPFRGIGRIYRSSRARRSVNRAAGPARSRSSRQAHCATASASVIGGGIAREWSFEMSRSVHAIRGAEHCSDEVPQGMNYGDSGHLLPVASSFVRGLYRHRANHPIMARLNGIAKRLVQDVSRPMRHLRIAQEKTVDGLGRAGRGASRVWVRTLEGNAATKESSGKRGMGEPEVLARRYEESNIVAMKCFGVCSREIRVCRRPRASGFVGNLRCRGVIGPMSRRAIADPRESDGLPRWRFRRAPGRSGRTMPGACNAETETPSAHEKTGGPAAASGSIDR